MGFVSHVQCSYQNNFMVDGVESRFMIGEYDAVYIKWSIIRGLK